MRGPAAFFWKIGRSNEFQEASQCVRGIRENTKRWEENGITGFVLAVFA